MAEAELHEGAAARKKKKNARVLLVEDHHMVRSALTLLLESAFGFDVLEASTAQEALNVAGTHSFDLAILDVDLPDSDGLTVLRSVRSTHPEVPVLMLSGYDNPDSVRAALELGARGYIVKGATSQQLREAIETSLTGAGVYVHPRVAGHLLDRDHPPAPTELSRRERSVLTKLLDGATNEEIARALYVSEKTVKTHLSGIYRKLGVSNRTQAVATAIRNNILPPDES